MEDPDAWARLACRITQGDREAEDELARALHPRIRLIASVRLHGSDAALDVAQDTIVAVIDALRAGHVREPARLLAFVHGIARNLINNHFRQGAQRAEILGDQPGDPPANSVSDDPIALRLDEERRRALVRAELLNVNDLDRRILLLTLNHGLTPREIAPLVGLTADVVRTRKSRAIKAIGEAIRCRDTKPSPRPHTVDVPKGPERQ